MAEVGKVCLLPTEEMFSFSDLYAPFFFSSVFLCCCGLVSCFFLATGVPNSIDFRARTFELFATPPPLLLSFFRAFAIQRPVCACICFCLST